MNDEFSGTTSTHVEFDRVASHRSRDGKCHQCVFALGL
jgi:hypothetical protein